MGKKSLVEEKGVKKVKPKISKEKSIQKDRIPSGIKNLDPLIKGGFEKNSINLIVAGSGSGKTIFCMEFLLEGIKKGENCLYITFEEKKEEFYKNMLEFGWDLEDAEKKGKFVFLEYAPEKVKMMLEEGGGAVESIVLKYKIQRIVIDSITSFSLLFDDELSKRQAALALFDIIRKWSCTSMITLQEEPRGRTDGTSSSLEFESDSIILLYFVRVKNERKRFVEVLKMRGTKHSTSVFPFEIRKGVEIGSKSHSDQGFS